MVLILGVFVLSLWGRVGGSNTIKYPSMFTRSLATIVVDPTVALQWASQECILKSYWFFLQPLKTSLLVHLKEETWKNNIFSRDFWTTESSIAMCQLESTSIFSYWSVPHWGIQTRTSLKCWIIFVRNNWGHSPKTKPLAAICIFNAACSSCGSSRAPSSWNLWDFSSALRGSFSNRNHSEIKEFHLSSCVMKLWISSNSSY